MFVWLFYVMTAAWVIGGALSMRRAICLKTRGEVIKARIVSHETSDGKTFTPVVGYDYLGKYHQCPCGLPGKKKYSSMDEVNITVAPQYPDKPAMEGENYFIQPVFCLIIAAFCLAVSIYLTTRFIGL